MASHDELIEEWRRWIRSMRNVMLRNGVIHGYDDTLFEAVFGPLDDTDRAEIETWRKRFNPPPRSKEPPALCYVVFSAPPGKGPGDFE